jgi:snurportin-1
MAPPQDTRRPFKRLAISDQQRRRDISLQRQAQSRRDAQHQARCLASTVLSLQHQTTPEPESNIELELVPESEESGASSQDLDVRHAAKLKGAEARKWFAKQLMLHEWMIDVPDRLSDDWSFFNLT